MRRNLENIIFNSSVFQIFFQTSNLMMLLPMFTTIILLWFILLTVGVDSRSCARTATPEVISSYGNNRRLSTIPFRRVIRQDINQQIGPAVIASSSPYSRLFQSFIYQSAPESEDNPGEIIDQSINKPADAKQHDHLMANRG